MGGGWPDPLVPVSVSRPAALQGLNASVEGDGRGGFWGAAGGADPASPFPRLEEAPGVGVEGGSWFTPSQHLEAGGGVVAQTGAWCWTGHVGFEGALKEPPALGERGGSPGTTQAGSVAVGHLYGAAAWPVEHTRGSLQTFPGFFYPLSGPQ